MAEDAETRLRELKTQRRQLKASLTRLKTFFDAFSDTNQLDNLKLRFAKAQSALSEFENIQTQIEVLDEDEINQDTRELFESNYFDIISRIQSYLDQFAAPVANSPAHASEHTTSSASRGSNQIKLPKVELPTFTGSYDQWMPFFDLFKSMIHDDESISDIQKFHYLRSSLRGEAARVIESLQISANNYPVAWNLIHARYNNKRLIIQTHVKALFELPTIRNESPTLLRQLTNDVLTHIRALKAMNQPTEYWDALIVHLVTTKLDFVTKREWEKGIQDTELPTMKKLNEFLSHRCQVLESLASTKQSNNTNVSTHNTKKSVNHFVSNIVCPICQESHFIYQCDKFLKQSVNWRLSQVKSKELCLNCLKPNHQAKQCKSSRCKKCNQSHNTLLHQNAQTNTESKANTSSNSSTNTNTNNTASVTHHYCQSQAVAQVILSTALVIVHDKNGNSHICRALLDSGSQSNFISEEFAKKLNLQRHQTSVSVTGINDSGYKIDSMINVNVKSRYNKFECNLSCLIIPRITHNLPLISFNKESINIPRTIRLADPSFNISSAIDMLIGAEVFYQLLCIGQIKPASASQPYWQKTQLGWIASGRIINDNQSATQTICTITTSKLDEDLANFWKLEEVSKKRVLTKEEMQCEIHFENTTQRNSDDRFVVNLPVKSNAPPLGESRQLALKRFYNLERKLIKDPELRETYTAFIQEYFDLGHMKLVDLSKDDSYNKSTFYLPHHAVFKESSATTKLRVVFDGSAKSSNGTSLNDIFLTGPVIQQDLATLIARFRIHTYVLVADITKMYRQVMVNPEQTSLQRILWRNNESEEVQTYELTTLTYGTTPASYLATRCLLQLAKEEANTYPKGSIVIARDFYVDDLLTEANTIEEAHEIQSEVTTILKKGGFELRKWASNEPHLLANLDNGNASLSYVELYTLLTQVESVLNSRPLTTISTDPNDHSFLTPGHFLIGDALTAIPEPSLEHIPAPRLSRWQHIELLKQHFWARWSREYLSQLQERTRRNSERTENFKPGQLVILRDDNIPPQRWSTGCITEIHPGADDVVRVATVRLPNGSTTRRAVSRLVLLPVDTHE